MVPAMETLRLIRTRWVTIAFTFPFSQVANDTGYSYVLVLFQEGKKEIDENELLAKISKAVQIGIGVLDTAYERSVSTYMYM